MRKYAKIVAICLIAVLSLGMLSACGGINYTGKDNGFIGDLHGISKSVQDTSETKVVHTDNIINYVDAPSSDTPDDENATPDDENTTPDDENTTPDNNDDNDNVQDPSVDGIVDTNNYTLVCMSFNLLGFSDASGAMSQPNERGPWQVEIIKKYDPDILGCQESSHAASYNGNYDAVGNIQKNFPGYSHYSNDAMGSNSMFWKKDRFELKDKGFDLYNATQGVSWVKLYDKKDNITVLFTNVHLAPGITTEVIETRSKQAIFLLDLWKKNCGKDMALYATGDYNCKLNSAEINLLSKEKFKSSGAIAAVSNATPGIDHIFINNDVQECINFHTSLETFEPEGVSKEEAGKKYWASDHKAVISYCNNSKRK